MITAPQLKSFLASQGIRENIIYLFDQNYVFPTVDCITDDIGNIMDNYLFDTGFKFSPKFECNKFAKLATTFADACHMKSAARYPLAFGVFCYFDGVELHGINIAVHRNPELSLGFYEPQPLISGLSKKCLTKIILDQADVKSCVVCLFL